METFGNAFGRMLDDIERAVDQHPILTRSHTPARSWLEGAEIVIGRNVYTARIKVKRGRQRRMFDATAFADTPGAAVDKLITSLDVVAEAIK